MTTDEALAYVDAAATAQGLKLDEAQRARVAVVFAHNAQIAALIESFELPRDCEPAPVFAP